jgi:hypothetical protein
MKCSKGLRNWVSTIMRIYRDYMKFDAQVVFSFIILSYCVGSTSYQYIYIYI